MTWVTNNINEHFESPSLYLNDFWMFDITCISGANILKEVGWSTKLTTISTLKFKNDLLSYKLLFNKERFHKF